MKDPMGWKPLPAPLSPDFDKGIPERDEDGKKVARPRNPRTEMYGWFRGSRYVRVCWVKPWDEEEGDVSFPYAVHTGDLKKLEHDHIDQSCVNSRTALIRARTLMRQGGY